MDEKRTVIIGAAILDVLARPVDPSVFEIGSLPAETIALSTGGDAMNEACVLASLGGKTRLVSKLGKDPGAELILARCPDPGHRYGIHCPEPRKYLPASMWSWWTKKERGILSPVRKGPCGSCIRKMSGKRR